MFWTARSRTILHCKLYAWCKCRGWKIWSYYEEPTMPFQEYPTYDRIGVRPLINCKGTLTMYSGSVMLPEVRQAMIEASRKYVHIEELMDGVGRRIGEIMKTEFGLVTNGCAAALCQVTAACVAGADPDHIARLPDTTGMKHEVITLKTHRHAYDHAIRMVGISLVEVDDDADSLRAAFSERTAMVAVFGDRAGDGGGRRGARQGPRDRGCATLSRRRRAA